MLSLGVQADYTAQRDELTVLRGRLDIKAQVLQRWGRVDRLICEFEERVREIPENQWLVRALRVARRGVKNAGVATFVRRIASTWEELCDDDPEAELSKPAITRTNHHYRHALNLAYLVTEGVTASNVLRSGSIGGFSFMLNMSRLFEEFVSCLLSRWLSIPGSVSIDKLSTGPYYGTQMHIGPSATFVQTCCWWVTAAACGCQLTRNTRSMTARNCSPMTSIKQPSTPSR